MSEQASNSQQQTIFIGLIVVAALLAAIIGVLVYQQAKGPAVPAPIVAADPGAAAAPAGMGAQQPAGEAAPFDATKATKVPAGTEPEAFVKTYYEACDKGDWKAAFDALPTAKKEGNSPDALKEQVTGYGIKGFKITSAKVEGDKATVVVDQVTGQYGTFENTWTFVKEGSDWLVETKAVTGMRQ